MAGKIFLCLHAVFTVCLMALEPCEKKKKPESYPPPFVEQQPIVRYGYIKESEFTIQLGERPHEGSLYDASVLASRLRGAGIACFIEKSQDGGKYRVCVGRYQSKVRARNMLKILASKNIRGGRIVGPFK